MKISTIMSTDLHVLERHHNLLNATEVVARANIRHVPIVDDQGKLEGLVTHRDLLSATITSTARVVESDERSFLAQVPLQRIMRSSLVCTAPGDCLFEAADTMLEHKLGCLPVLVEGVLVGLVTEADFISLATEYDRRRDRGDDGPEERRITRALKRI